MLPWVTGNPHALFARVRGITATATTPWSGAFGFDMTPGPPPKPLASEPGLLRWTPIEGADGYQVWFIDINNPTPKMETVFTNVLDEREFYTFHRTASWTGTVRWRIRALAHRPHRRQSEEPTERTARSRLRPVEPGLQLLQSSVRRRTDQARRHHLRRVSHGDASSPAHRLMPAFTFTGDQALDGTSAELFRIYVFTDRQCLNRVFASAVVGGPAYAPRPFGPLALPAQPPHCLQHVRPISATAPNRTATATTA